MARTQVSIRSDTYEWWQELKEQVAEERDGYEPDNAELLRMMMEQFDPERRGGLR